MPLSEYDIKEALRAAADWLVASELPGSAAAREGIADTIPLVMMGEVEPNDLDDLAAIVEDHGRAVHDAATPEDVQRAQLKEAVKGRVRLRAWRKGHRDLPVFFDELNDALEAHDAEEEYDRIAGAMRALLARRDEKEEAELHPLAQAR
jgi:hypothetical protein